MFKFVAAWSLKHVVTFHLWFNIKTKGTFFQIAASAVTRILKRFLEEIKHFFRCKLMISMYIVS